MQDQRVGKQIHQRGRKFTGRCGWVHGERHGNLDGATRTKLGVEGATKQRCKLKVKKVLTNYLMEGKSAQRTRATLQEILRGRGVDEGGV